MSENMTPTELKQLYTAFQRVSRTEFNEAIRRAIPHVGDDYLCPIYADYCNNPIGFLCSRQPPTQAVEILAVVKQKLREEVAAGPESKNLLALFME